jgi:stage III sporulation protein AE
MEHETILKKQLENVLQGEDIEGISEEAYRMSEGISDSFTIENILNATLEGESIFQNFHLIDSLTDLLLYEVQTALILCVEIMSIILITGMLKSLIDGFGSKGVSQLSLMVCSMVIIGISLNSFQISYQLAMSCMSAMVYTMEILMPILIGILLATGSVTSGTVLSPVIIGAVTGFGFIIKTFILPALFVSATLTLANCLTEKDYVNKFAKLIRSAAVFITGLILTLLGGIISIQGLLTESADGLLINAAKYSLSSFIPIVGGFTSDTV